MFGWELNTTLFVIGAGVGLVVAVAGAVVEYWLNLRHAVDGQRTLPGCMLYVSGGLALAGVVALVASLLLTGGIRAALVMGAGVLGGFYAGFAVLLLAWVLIERVGRRRGQPEAPAGMSAEQGETPL